MNMNGPYNLAQLEMKRCSLEPSGQSLKVSDSSDAPLTFQLSFMAEQRAWQADIYSKCKRVKISLPKRVKLL